MQRAKQTRRKMRQPRLDPDTALAQDAAKVLRQLRRKHRRLFDADRRHFRDVIKRAVGRLCRLRPGPKADLRIARAARELARGANVKDLFRTYIDGYASMCDFTRSLAEE